MTASRRAEPAWSGRIDDIEILRGIAVLMVVAHHVNGNLVRVSAEPLQTFYHYFGGWTGVDLFFAISGFVIARGLLPQLRQAGSGRDLLRVTLRFWVRRMFRLFPAAWAWLLLILALALFYNRSGVFGDISTNFEGLLAGVLQLANLRFVFSFGQAPMGASFHYWSLSLEEQFYLLLPLAFLLLRRWLLAALVIAAVLQILQSRGLWLMMFRSDAICLGVLLALFSETERYRRWQPRWLRPAWAWALPIGALLAALAVMGSTALREFRYHVGAVALISIALTWLASYDAHYLGRALPFARVLVWIGARSYGIYLMHIPVMFFVRETWYRSGLQPHITAPWMLICFLVLLLLLAELSLRCLESPLREHGRRVAAKLLSEPSRS